MAAMWIVTIEDLIVEGECYEKNFMWQDTTH